MDREYFEQTVTVRATERMNTLCSSSKPTFNLDTFFGNPNFCKKRYKIMRFGQVNFDTFWCKLKSKLSI